ncbi:hypothetical protein [Paraburkholderia sp. BL6669N2]|uniref:hypothetical protein n=1 Tax=Paraburkholderia sp. BL6669N2 TaxID=1938807 RepID=UPI0011C01CE6|nr:hypothetical protein [Paraburkholderia sp. BL6669N2]
MQYLLRRAAVAAILFDPIGAKALLDLPDAEVGRRFKISLARLIGRATVLNVDLASIREEDGRSKRGSERRRPARDSLVAEGKLLRAAIVCAALGITERQLTSDLAAGRIFNVDINADEFYPAFFLASELDRRQLAKVVRRLDGLTGWAKWRFFTEPKASLANLTPLQALLHGEMKPVLQTADAFIARSNKLEKGKVSGTRNH